MENRTHISDLRDIPNVGPAIAGDLKRLGISAPFELIGKDPYGLYSELCKVTGKRVDPCVADVFISAVRYMEGEPARKWWHYTKERKLNLKPE